jgi:DNA-binding Lrp family transcriptional regulator
MNDFDRDVYNRVKKGGTRSCPQLANDMGVSVGKVALSLERLRKKGKVTTIGRVK